MSGTWLPFHDKVKEEKAIEFVGIFSRSGATWVSTQGFKPTSKEVLRVIDRMETNELMDNENDERRNLPGPLLDGCYYGFSRMRGSDTAYGQLLQSSSMQSHTRGSKSIIVHLTLQTCIMVTYEGRPQEVQDAVASIAKKIDSYGF